MESNTHTNGQLEQALNRCAKEAIQFVGAIQPHGVLLAVDGAGILRLCSNNLEETFGQRATDALNKPVEELIGKTTLEALRATLANPNQRTSRRIEVTCVGKNRNFFATTFLSRTLMIIELVPEPETAPRSYEDSIKIIHECQRALAQQTDIKSFCQFVAQFVRRITDCDRTVVYRFDSRWNGEVVSESGIGLLPSLLKQHFPASDIPAQARALCKINLVRILLDTEAEVVPILPQSTCGHLDLTHSMLRAISPSHLQYLRHMGVRSTITLSLIHDGKLWGMVFCHNAQPKELGPYLTEELGMILRTFNLKLDALEHADRAKSIDLVRKKLQNVTEVMRNATSIDHAIAAVQDEFLALADASGCYLVLHNYSHAIGTVPSQEATYQLVTWLSQQKLKQGIFVTDNLPTHFPPAKAWAHKAVGVLAIALNTENTNFLLWFRRETMRGIPWAGRPYTHLTRDADGPVLRPRRCFAVWTENMRGFSTPGSDTTVDMMQMASFALVQLLTQQTSQSEAVAVAANNAKSEFLATVSHELRTPLTSIGGAIGLVLSNKLDPLPDKARQVLEIAQRNSARLNHLVNDLLDIEKILSGKLDLQLNPHRLMPLVDETLRIMQGYCETFNVHFQVLERCEDVYVKVDAIRFGQALSNLLSNAIKYSPENSIVSIRVSRQSVTGSQRIRVEVRDQGEGIPEKFRSRIFEKFAQSGVAANNEISSTGLGLAVTRDLIQRMGGRIDFESTEGEGSCFFFDLDVFETSNRHSI